MAVKDLVLGLPEAGKIKCGMKGPEIVSAKGTKFRPPVKLDHYIITGNVRDDSGDYVMDHDLMARIAKQGGIVRDENLVGIPGRLLYNDSDLNFPTRYAKYTGSKCVCHGDGETGHPSALTKTIKCPCADLEAGACKINGKLHFVIDGSENFGTCHVLRTTSINTVKSILGSMEMIKAATGGLLAFVPLMLMLHPRTTMVPSTGVTVTIYVSSLVFKGGADDLRQKALEMAKEKSEFLTEMAEVEANARKLLEYQIESEEEQEEIAAEFYPEEPANGKPEPEPPKKAGAKKPKPEKQPADNSATDKGTAGSVDTQSGPDSAQPETVQPAPERKPIDDSPVEPADDGALITNDQKREILRLKKLAGISDPADWKKILEQITDKPTANAFTEKEAGALILKLKGAAGEDLPL
ncbi:MAG: hypothetical protein ABIJ57_05625 [Pseudomonadota bacterium]